MATINLPFGASATRRAPDTDELANGYGCGDADLSLFDWMAWWLTGQTAGAMSKAGLAVDDTDLFRLARAIRRGTLKYATAGGTANALTAALDPAPITGEIAAGFELLLKVGTTNTGAATLNVNGGGAVAIKDMLGNALVSGALVAGSLVRIAFDGTNWQVQPTPGAVAPILASFTDTTAGTRTYTATVTGWHRVELVGAGAGGGGGVSTGCGGGGGGGGRAIDYVFLVAGTAYTYTIGAKGVGGSAGFNGTNGSASSFVGPAGTIVATGGSAGVGANTGSGGGGGSAGTGSGVSSLGSIDPGQSGFQGSPQIGQSGQGGSSPAGGYGAPASFALSGGATSPGGAGAGGTQSNAGSDGTNGRLVLQALGG